MTAGNMLLEAAAQAGYYGLMTRTSGPQIRGGEAAAMAAPGNFRHRRQDDRFHVLAAIDWQNVGRFASELAARARQPPRRRPRPGRAAGAVHCSSGARYLPVPFKALAKSDPGRLAEHGGARRAGRPAAACRSPRWSARCEKSTRRAAPRLPPARGGQAGHRRGGQARRAFALAAAAGRVGALADHRQRGRGPGRAAGRRALRRRLSDHAGDRAARMDGARAGEAGRRAGAGRGRTGLDQHDPRRLLRRRARRSPRPRARACR